MPVLEERVDTLEMVLANFIENTDRVIAEIHANNDPRQQCAHRFSVTQGASTSRQRPSPDGQNRRLFELQSQHDHEENRRANDEFRAEVQQWRTEELALVEQYRTEDRTEARSFRAEDKAGAKEYWQKLLGVQQANGGHLR